MEELYGVNSFMVAANQAVRKHVKSFGKVRVTSVVVCRNARKLMAARWKKSKLV